MILNMTTSVVSTLDQVQQPTYNLQRKTFTKTGMVTLFNNYFTYLYMLKFK